MPAKKEETAKEAKAEVKEEKKPKEAKAEAKEAKKATEEKEAKPKAEKKEEKPKEGSKEEKPKKEEKKGSTVASLKEQVAKGLVKTKEEKKEEAPEQSKPVQSRRNEFVAVAHVYSSKNNVIVNVTDLSGAETLASASGGMVVKSGREERTPFAGIQAAKRVAQAIKEKGVTTVDILIRGKGGHAGQKTPGRAASAVIKGFATSGLRIRRIEDVTPIPHGGCKPPGGKRGRRV